MSAITIGWEPPEPWYCGDTSEQERAEEAWLEEQFMEWASAEASHLAAAPTDTPPE